jgi:hypothetical protein
MSDHELTSMIYHGTFIVKRDGSPWVQCEPAIRLQCYEIFVNMKFLVKQFDEIIIQPVDELDQNNWIVIMKSVDAANKLNIQSYNSWDAKMLPGFQSIQYNLRLGLKTIKKYKPDFVYDLEGKIKTFLS